MDAELEKLVTLVKGSMDPVAAVRAAVAAVAALAPPDTIDVPGAHEETRKADQGHAQGLPKEEEASAGQSAQGEEDPHAAKDEAPTTLVEDAVVKAEAVQQGEANGGSSEPGHKPVASQPETDTPKAAEEQAGTKAAEEAEGEHGAKQQKGATSSPTEVKAEDQSGDAAAKQEGHKPQKSWPVPEIKAATKQSEEEEQRAEREVFPDLHDALKAFRKCTALVNVFRATPATANKTTAGDPARVREPDPGGADLLGGVGVGAGALCGRGKGDLRGRPRHLRPRERPRQEQEGRQAARGRGGPGAAPGQRPAVGLPGGGQEQAGQDAEEEAAGRRAQPAGSQAAATAAAESPAGDAEARAPAEDEPAGPSVQTADAGWA